MKWDELIPLLVAEHGDKLRKIDADALADYCEAHESKLEAIDRLKKHGSRDCVGPNGALYPHPAVGDKNKAVERMAKLRKELGFSFTGRKVKKTEQGTAKRKPA